MTIHLQETAQNEFLHKFVKFTQRMPVWRLAILGSKRECDPNSFQYKQWMQTKHKTYSSKTPPFEYDYVLWKDLDPQTVYFVSEIFVEGVGQNPTTKFHLFSPETTTLIFSCKWQEIDFHIENCIDEPIKEEGYIYDVSNKQFRRIGG